MASDAKAFIDNWIAENVRASQYDADRNAREAKGLAVLCWRMSDQAHFSREAIDAAVGDLVAYMTGAMTRANDRATPYRAD